MLSERVIELETTPRFLSLRSYIDDELLIDIALINISADTIDLEDVNCLVSVYNIDCQWMLPPEEIIRVLDESTRTKPTIVYRYFDLGIDDQEQRDAVKAFIRGNYIYEDLSLEKRIRLFFKHYGDEELKELTLNLFGEYWRIKSLASREETPTF